MTTMAALLGGVPMMVGTGVGSEIRQPLGYAIVGGLARVADAHALYDAGRLYLSRPAAELDDARKKEASGLQQRRAAACGMTGKSYARIVAQCEAGSRAPRLSMLGKPGNRF